MTLAPGDAQAVEGGGSNYLLGMRGPLAAFVPKPGVYLTNNVYYYDAGRSDLTPIGDRVVGDISAEALTNIAQFSWVTDVSVMGGRLAFSGVLPYGNLEVGGNVVVPVAAVRDQAVGRRDGSRRSRRRRVASAGSTATATGSGPGACTRRCSSRSVTTRSGASPTRARTAGRSTSGAAYTMANFKGGREFSTVLGFTFNGENHDTNYDSGNEMHLEMAGKQYLPNHFSLGVVGYWNEQLTADSGGPALLGDFKGRVFGIGPELSYQFTQSKTHPVTLDLRWYHEFDAKNRVEGDGVFFTFSVPLSIQQKPAADQDWSADQQDTTQNGETP